MYFTIFKPEYKRCMNEFEDYLVKEGFEIESRHPILSWGEFSKKLYLSQISASRIFETEMNAYHWLTDSLFGDSAVVVKLYKKGPVLDNLKKLFDIKNNFRKDISQRLDEPIKLYLDLDKLKVPKPENIGYKGSLTLIDGEKKLSYDGRWDEFYFKYVHTPDPSEDILNRELKVLKENGIFENTISRKEWEIMIKLGTLKVSS